MDPTNGPIAENINIVKKSFAMCPTQQFYLEGNFGVVAWDRIVGFLEDFVVGRTEREGAQQ